MPEQTETTPTQEVITTPPATEQGAAGATTTPAPSKTNEGQETTTQEVDGKVDVNAPKPVSKEVAQQRIDRMYARLQDERQRRMAAEALAKSKVTPIVTEGEDGEAPKETVKPMTEADIDAAIDRRERGRKMVESEIRVFERHPSALNDDGSFNMSDPFVQKYVEIGRLNPTLGVMDNGPELAEALADKQLGIDYRKGRKDEAVRTTNPANSFTTSSTTTPPPASPATTLSAGEQKVARRMSMSDKEYADFKSNKVPQKSWVPKRK